MASRIFRCIKSTISRQDALQLSEHALVTGRRHCHRRHRFLGTPLSRRYTSTSSYPDGNLEAQSQGSTSPSQHTDEDTHASSSLAPHIPFHPSSSTDIPSGAQAVDTTHHEPKAHVAFPTFPANYEPPPTPEGITLQSDIPVPARPRGYPTPWMQRQQYEEYFLPLSRRGWSIKFRRVEMKAESSPPSPTTPTQTPWLLTSYDFRDHEAAAEFVKDVEKIVHEENVSIHRVSDAVTVIHNT